MSFTNPLKPLSAALNSLGLPFTIVGSMASSARGIPRATMDIDIVVRIGPFHAERLAVALGAEWYVEPAQIRDAIQAGRAFNVIHMRSGWKVDFFPAHSEFHASEMQRATMEPVVIEGDEVSCPVSPAEDTLLAKRRWYRDGGETSDRQWGDITGLIGANPDLDLEYVRPWASRLGVSDLLARALAVSDVPPPSKR